MRNVKKTMKNSINAALMLILLLFLPAYMFAGETQWMAVGTLHDWFHSAGCEIEVGRTYQVDDQQDGLRWPAQFRYQDSKAAKALWIGCKDFDDPVAGQVYNYKVVHVGPRVLDEQNEFMTEQFKLKGRFDHPRVLVDDIPASQLDFMEVVDEVDETLIADRVLENVVHTSLGLTMKRTIYAFTNQNHDNYFIYDYVFKNTGIINLNGDVYEQTLKDLIVHYQYRYAPSREGGPYGYYWLPQSTSWGHNTMNDVIYRHPETGEPFRALISWHGKHSKWDGPGDNVGAPNYLGNGRLGAVQHLGVLTLHADKSTSDKSDDPAQPSTTKEVGSDDPWTYNNDQYNAPAMATEYQEVMTAGRPELSHAERVGDGSADLYGGTPGGYSQAHGFGPYTLDPGDSIRIVMAEGVSGLARDSCYTIGEEWFENQSPFNLPPPEGGTTNDRNEYKNAWVYTGYDSLIKTFEYAQINFENDLQIPQAPPPPEQFTVNSGGDRIILRWASNAESWVDPNYGNEFQGYRVYRAIQRPDTLYEMIFECGPGTDHPQIVNEFSDRTARRGFDFYYYVTAFDDGSSPDGTLESGKFYTMTNEPAFLRRPPGERLDNIRIVPNPYNIKAQSLQFGESGKDRLLFVNLPPFCEIKIYTERGDLIKTMNHDDGSGDEAWNSVTSSRQVVVSGVYIAYIEVTRDHTDAETGDIIFKKGDSITKKFVIVR